MDRLNFDKSFTEPFGLNTIALSYDKKYFDFVKGEDGDIDYINEEENIGLEITTVLSKNTKEVMNYESSLEKGKSPDHTRIECSYINEDKELLFYSGGSTEEFKGLILNAISEKVEKRKSKKKRDRYELSFKSTSMMCLALGDAISVNKGILLTLTLHDSKYPRISCNLS